MPLDSRRLSPDDIFSNLPVVTDEGGRSFVVTPETDFQLPDNIERHDFFTSRGVPLRFYTAPAKNEKCVIMGASGYKTDFVLNMNEVKTLNNQGFSISWLAIPNPKRHIDFMEHLMEAVREVILEPRNSVIKEWCAKKSDKYFWGHSTGAQLFLRSAEDDNSLRKLNILFSGAVLSSIYVSPPNLESAFSPASLIYNAYAYRHQHDLPSETRMGRVYLNGTERAEETVHEFTDHTEPTYAQTQILRRGGKHVWRAAQNPEANLHKLKFPLLIAAGEKDRFSSPYISADIARRLKAAFYYAHGKEHAPFSNNREGLQLAMDSMRAMSDGTFNQFTAEKGLNNYQVNRERFPVAKLAFSAARSAAPVIMRQLLPFPAARHTPPESVRTPS